MSRLCLASTAVRDRLQQRLPDSELAATAAVWSDIATIPDGADEIEFWVPPFLLSDPAQAREAAAGLPNLKVIQTQSAGVDAVLQFVPERGHAV